MKIQHRFTFSYKLNIQNPKTCITELLKQGKQTKAGNTCPISSKWPKLHYRSKLQSISRDLLQHPYVPKKGHQTQKNPICMQLDAPWYTCPSLKTVEPTASLTCMVLESCCHNTKLVPRLQGWCRHPWRSRAFSAGRYLCLEEDPCRCSRDSDILPEPAPTLLLALVKEISLTKQKYKS